MLKLKLFLHRLLGYLTKWILGSHVHSIVARSGENLFAVGPEDFMVGRKLRMAGNYGEEEINRLERYLGTEAKVLIVGAHIGTLAIPISRRCVSVVAIEANPNTFELLLMNLKLNSITNCRPLNIAASDKEEDINFLLSRVNSGGSKRAPINRKFIYYFDRPKEISVKGYCLDDYLKGEAFDVIIMDIEGSEYFALKGMQNTLSSAKVLAMEFLPHHLRNVSGVDVKTFLAAVSPHFSVVTIPVLNERVGSERFLEVMSHMYENDIGDESILFEKG